MSSLVLSAVAVAVELDGLELASLAVRNVQELVVVDVAEYEGGHGWPGTKVLGTLTPVLKGTNKNFANFLPNFDYACLFPAGVMP